MSVSMSEERHQGELPEAQASSFKMALGVTGIVVGLGLLFCGGVAGYVAFTGPPLQTSEKVAPANPDHSDTQSAAPATVEIDLPHGFELINSQASPPLLIVIFGRQTDASAKLLIGKIGLLSVPGGVSLEKVREMMLQKLQMASEQGRTFRPLPDSIDTQRELTVLGQRAPIEITHGTLGSSAIRVAKVSGLFRTKLARIGVVYIIPEDEFDEESVVQMFKSIKPAAGDSFPAAGVTEIHSPADSSDGPGAQPSKTKPEDEAKPESGLPLP
jgi:hypothetical protein